MNNIWIMNHDAKIRTDDVCESGGGVVDDADADADAETATAATAP